MSVVESVRDRILGGDGVRMGDERVQPVPLTQSDLHQMLRVDRRRLVISFLVLDSDGVATVSDTAEYVAMVETGAESTSDVTSEERKRVYVGLIQTHLEKLDDWGVVDYDPDRKIVRTTWLAREVLKIDRGVSRVTTGVPR